LSVSIEQILLTVAILLVLGVVASKTSGRLGVPALLVFLVIGILAGAEGLGGIPFNDPWIAQLIGIVALSVILFSGGLDTSWSRVRPVLWEGLTLSTLGVFLTASLVGSFAYLLGFSLLESLLLGAVVSSTDAAAVFSILRAQDLRLKNRLKSLLELESGSNDPMAIFLTIGLVHLIMSPEASPYDLIWMFFLQMSIGMLIGLAMGRMIPQLMNYLRLNYDGLYPVFLLATVLFTYGISTLLGGNGFLAVYVTGVVMGSTDFIHKRGLAQFNDGLAWLMQIVMFIVLGLLVFPSQLLAVSGLGLLISLFLIFIARPLSVFAALSLSPLSNKEKLLTSWVGLRGAVPIVLATIPLLAGVPNSQMIFNVVFFIVMTSVLIQGTTVAVVTNWLGLIQKIPAKARSPFTFEGGKMAKNDLRELDIDLGSPAIGKSIVELGLPKDALIVLIVRQKEYLIPSGGTVIEAGDAVFALCNKATLSRVEEIFRIESQNRA